MKAVKGYRYLYLRESKFYFRRRVPLAALSSFPRDVVQKALLTSSIAEARHLLAIEVATFDNVVAEATGAPIAKGLKQIISKIGPEPVQVEEAVRRWLADRVERGTRSELVRPDDARQSWLGLKAQAADVRQGTTLAAEEPALTTLWLAEAICEAECWDIERNSSVWRQLVRLIGRGQIEANGWLAADLNGDARIVQDARFSSEQFRVDEVRKTERAERAPVSIGLLLEGYLREHKPQPATEKVWRRHVTHFTRFLKHEDAALVTLQDVVAWKDSL